MEQMNYVSWVESPYSPVPSIIDAALELRKGLSIREIDLREASKEEIENVRNKIQKA
jgi:hypothetical protein